MSSTGNAVCCMYHTKRHVSQNRVEITIYFTYGICTDLKSLKDDVLNTSLFVAIRSALS